MSNQIATTTVRGLLDKDSVKKRINEIMGRRGPQFSAALVQLTKQNFMLQKCRPETVVGAALTAAALDLPIDPNLGQAHVVPYGQDAQFQMGYKGFIQLAQRSGQMLRMNDVVIPKGALVGWNPLTEELVVDFDREEVDWNADPAGYAFYFKTVSGFEKTVFWSYDRVLAHAKRFSKSFNKGSSPWQSDFDAMALKSVIKYALNRYGPLSVEVQRLAGRDQGVIDIDDNVKYPDNPTNGDGEGGLKRAEFEDVTEAEEAPEPKPEAKGEPAEDTSKNDAKDNASKDDAKEKKQTLDIIENAIVDTGFSETKFLEFLARKNLCAASAKTLKDIPLSKLKKIEGNLEKLINDYAVGE